MGHQGRPRWPFEVSALLPRDVQNPRVKADLRPEQRAYPFPYRWADQFGVMISGHEVDLHSLRRWRPTGLTTVGWAAAIWSSWTTASVSLRANRPHRSPAPAGYRRHRRGIPGGTLGAR